MSETMSSGIFIFLPFGCARHRASRAQLEVLSKQCIP